MTKHEQLQEQYEDALFALLMDDFAVTVGEAAIEENERLQKDPNYEVPLEVRKRCLKTISKCCQKRTLFSTGRALRRGFIRVAAIATISMLLFTTALAVSPTLRAKTLNFLIEIFDERTELSFLEPDLTQAHPAESNQIVVNWLPEGYTLAEESDSTFRSSVSYSSESGHEITINVFKGENGGLNIDTEGAQIETIIVQGCDGILALKDDTTQLIWGDQENLYKIHLVTDGTEDEDIQNLMKIAENLVIKNN